MPDNSDKEGVVLCSERDGSHFDFAAREPGGMKPCTASIRHTATSTRRTTEIFWYKRLGSGRFRKASRVCHGSSDERFMFSLHRSSDMHNFAFPAPARIWPYLSSIWLYLSLLRIVRAIYVLIVAQKCLYGLIDVTIRCMVITVWQVANKRLIMVSLALNLMFNTMMANFTYITTIGICRMKRLSSYSN